MKIRFMKMLQIVGIMSLCTGAVPLDGWSQVFFTENFEQGSVFGPAPGYARSTLASVASAPTTTPALHIGQGGDWEFLYTDASVTQVTAFAPSGYGNVRIDSYLGIGSGGSIGGISGGLILRATGPSDYYLAYINTNPGDPRSGDFFLAQSIGGLIDTFTGFSIPDFDPLHEDYHITFEASGTWLSASLSRERVVGGVVIETFLGSASAMDSRLTSGQAGLYSFARNANNVFFDDVAVSAVPEPRAAVLLCLGLALAAVISCGRRSFTNPGKEQANSMTWPNRP